MCFLLSYSPPVTDTRSLTIHTIQTTVKPMSATPSHTITRQPISSNGPVTVIVYVVPEITVLDGCDEKVYSVFNAAIPAQSHISRYGVSAYTADPTATDLGTRMTLRAMKDKADAWTMEVQDLDFSIEGPLSSQVSRSKLEAFILNLEEEIRDPLKVKFFDPAMSHSELDENGLHPVTCTGLTLYDIGSHVVKVVGDLWSR